MEGHDSMLLGWYQSTPTYPPVDLPPGPQGPSTSNLVRLPPGDYPDLRTPIIHPHEPGDPTPSSGTTSIVHPSVSMAQSGMSTTHSSHISQISQPHMTTAQISHIGGQITHQHVVQQVIPAGHTLVQMVGVPTSGVSGTTLNIGQAHSSLNAPIIQVIESNDGPPFRCAECDHVAKTKRMLKRHLATVHSQERNYACSFCNAKYKSRSGLRVHSIKHNVGKHKCELCEKLFPYKGALEEHMKVVHEDFRFKCVWEGCTFTTTSKYLLKGHVSYNHEGGKFIDNKFRKKCRFCEYIGYDIRGHESAMHGLAPRFECPTCGKKFHFGSNLRQHKKVHLPLEQYPFVCEVCGDRFLRRRQLEDHFIGKHTNEKPHLCVKCGFSCASRRTMSDHVAANCYEKEAAFRCKFCSFETKIPFTMRTHKEKCHSKNQTKRKKTRKVWQSDSDNDEDVENAGDETTEGAAQRRAKGSRKAENYMPWSVKPDQEDSDEEPSEVTSSEVAGDVPRKRGRPAKAAKKPPKPRKKPAKKRAPRKKKRSSSDEEPEEEEENEMSDMEEDEDDEMEERILLDELAANDSDSEAKKKKNAEESVPVVKPAEVQKEVERRARPPKRKAAIAALERQDDGSQDEFFEEPPVPVSRKPAKKRHIEVSEIAVEDNGISIDCDDGDEDDMMMMNCGQCNMFFISQEKFSEHMKSEHQFEMTIVAD